MIIPSEASRRQAAKLVFTTALRADPLCAAVSVLRQVYFWGWGVLSIWLLKLLVDGAVARDTRRVLVVSAWFAGLFAVDKLQHWMGDVLHRRLFEKTMFVLDRQFADRMMAIPGIEHHEDPRLLNYLQALRWERYNFGDVIDAVAANLGVLIQAVATLVLLARLHPVLLLMPLVGVPIHWVGWRTDKRRHKLNDELAETQRFAERLYGYLVSPEAGREMRVFGLGAAMRKRWYDVSAGMARRRIGFEFRAAAREWVGEGLIGLGFGVATAFVALRAVRGHATAGDVVLVIGLLGKLADHIWMSQSFGEWILWVLTTIRRLMGFMEYASRAAAPPDAVPCPVALADGIRLEGVVFRYPDTERDVLAGVDLHLPAGSVVALVGDNGAGKTTLVKLLCRMYTPSAGRITLDGTDLAAIDPDERRANTSAAFQDFLRPHFLAREAIGIGRIDAIDDDETLAAGLERAGADRLMRALPQGLDTQLGTTFEGGVELSRGQWQQLALGRAMLRATPLLLVLDEPTAALDPPTEHALFERYTHAARRTAAAVGGITLLVSHRFSTVRMADLIVVLDQGRVAQLGSHTELMASGGMYAELYELQARAYR